MNRTILVPIDISDSELTQRVISHVEAEAKIDDAEVHFLTVIPSLPYYASLGLAYSAECQPTECMSMLKKARPKTAFWNWRRRSPLI